MQLTTAQQIKLLRFNRRETSPSLFGLIVRLLLRRLIILDNLTCEMCIAIVEFM